ncbi:MAG: hypothetical protein RL469_456 [Pseudomonadota bacterium]
MNETLSLTEIVGELASREGLSEVLGILIAAALAVAAGRYAGPVFGRRIPAGARSPDDWRAQLGSLAAIITPYVFSLLTIGLVFGLATRLGISTTILAIAFQLVILLVAVRLGVFALGLLLGGTGWIRRWEARITLVLWLALGFELLGWFGYIEGTLDSIDLLPGKATFSLWSLLKSIVVVTGFVIVTSLVARAVERRIMAFEDLAPSTRIGISKVTYFLLVSLGILLGINAAGVDLTALTVLTGAIGLGLGFGLQAIASNFVSGFVLLLDRSIKPGDVISFTQHTGTSTDNFGWVQELRGRYVVVRDRDGVETLVPNQNLITNSVINWSYSDQRVRLRLPVMISYQDDPELALRLLAEATSDHPRILKDPPAAPRLMSFEDYGMRLEVRFWIRDPMNGVNNVRSDVNRRIFQLFREYGITIPVAQREVRIVDPGAMLTRSAPRADDDADTRG